MDIPRAHEMRHVHELGAGFYASVPAANWPHTMAMPVCMFSVPGAPYICHVHDLGKDHLLCPVDVPYSTLVATWSQTARAPSSSGRMHT